MKLRSGGMFSTVILNLIEYLKFPRDIMTAMDGDGLAGQVGAPDGASSQQTHEHFTCIGRDCIEPTLRTRRWTNGDGANANAIDERRGTQQLQHQAP